MAKAFYTQDEAKDALNTDDAGLKDFVQDGRLTEYRDGANLMYKGSQVEGLAAELGAGDDIGMSDSGGPIGLADSGGDITLADDEPTAITDTGDSGVSGLSDLSDDSMADSAGNSAAMMASDDTGSFALGDTGAGASYNSAAGASASGITIFEDDDVDPSAQTSIGSSGSSDQVNLEGIGSGSGLLDLTQEPDDTSFGAETFDEIMPEGSVAGGTVGGLDLDDDHRGGIDTGAAPIGTRPVGVAYEPVDATAPLFGGLAAGAAAVMLIGLLAVALAATNASSPLTDMFVGEDGAVNLVPTLAVIFGLPIVGAIVGFIGGKMGSA